MLENTSGRSLFEKTLQIEIHETFYETPKSKVKNEKPKPVKKEKFVARGKFSILNAIKYAQQESYMCYLFDVKKRVYGKLHLQNFTVNSHYSFTDLYIKKNLNIVPIIAVDFSLANLTFDES